MSKSDWKSLSLLGGVVALAWDLTQAAEHRRTCPKCVGGDYLSVALDVAHLAQAA